MLLAIDAGNTNIVLGLFQGKRLKRTWRVPSTSDALRDVSNKLPSGVESVIVSSVVPYLKSSFEKLSRRACGKKALFVSDRLKMPIRVKLPNPRQLGQDRIVNAVAAYAIHGRRGGVTPPLLVVDFGTATTIDVVTAQGDYIGGTISPGIGIANAALHDKTALLPLVPIRKPKRVIGNSTSSAIQSGVFYGYAGLIDGLVRKIAKELRSRVKVIATGGLSTVVGPACETIDVIDPDLTLHGLRILFEINQKTRKLE